VITTPIEHLSDDYLRECELDSALAQTRADLAAGRSVQESPEAHLERLGKL
jgi:hypothetical protein